MFRVKHTLLAISLVAICPALAHADPGNEGTARARMGETTGQAKLQTMVDESTAVYRSIAKTSKGEIPASVLKNARCIAVLPNVMGGAIAVGGAHGTGLASCKTADGAWSQPVPISLSEASIGLQVGAKSTDTVLFFQSPASVAALKKGKLAFGTDASAVAGKYDAAFDASSSGVVIYSGSNGLFAGASVNGNVVSDNKDEMANIYGRSASCAGVLDGKENPDTAGISKKLTSLFPS